MNFLILILSLSSMWLLKKRWQKHSTRKDFHYLLPFLHTGAFSILDSRLKRTGLSQMKNPFVLADLHIGYQSMQVHGYRVINMATISEYSYVYFVFSQQHHGWPQRGSLTRDIFQCQTLTVVYRLMVMGSYVDASFYIANRRVYFVLSHSTPAFLKTNPEEEGGFSCRVRIQRESNLEYIDYTLYASPCLTHTP